MVKNVRVPNVEYLENNKPETFEKCFNASNIRKSQWSLQKLSHANKSWLTVYVVHENISIFYLVAPSIKYIYSNYWYFPILWFSTPAETWISVLHLVDLKFEFGIKSVPCKNENLYSVLPSIYWSSNGGYEFVTLLILQIYVLIIMMIKVSCPNWVLFIKLLITHPLHLPEINDFIVLTSVNLFWNFIEILDQIIKIWDLIHFNNWNSILIHFTKEFWLCWQEESYYVIRHIN